MSCMTYVSERDHNQYFSFFGQLIERAEYWRKLEEILLMV